MQKELEWYWQMLYVLASAVNVRHEILPPSPQHSLMTSNCAHAFSSEGGGLEFVHTELK